MVNQQVTSKGLGSSGNEMFTSHDTSTKGQKHFRNAALLHREHNLGRSMERLHQPP